MSDESSAPVAEVPTVESFFGEPRQIPASHGSYRSTPVQAYFSSGRSFNVHFGHPAVGFDLWTTEEGLEAIIGACQSALVRARIAVDEANGVPA